MAGRKIEQWAPAQQRILSKPRTFRLHYLLIHAPKIYGARPFTRGHRQDTTWPGEVDNPLDSRAERPSTSMTPCRA